MVWFIERLQRKDVSRVIRMISTSIQNVSSELYSEEQLRAWAGEIQENPLVHQRFYKGYSLVAKEGDNQLIGFGTLDLDCIDFLYTAPDWQGEGLGGEMLQALEEQAAKEGVEVLRTEASAAAERFFQKHGYMLKKRQVKSIQGVSIKNAQMYKKVLK